VWKTRGAIATEALDPGNPGEPVIARAGHRLDRGRRTLGTSASIGSGSTGRASGTGGARRGR
jgi:hypothetical protein